ncbi:hypothetical protein D9M68_609190 [compost metagenome]
MDFAFVEQRAQLPVTAAQRSQQDALRQVFGGYRREDRTVWRRISLAGDYPLRQPVFQQPLMLALVVLLQPAAQRLRGQAQGPVTTGCAALGLTQQQVDLPAVARAEGVAISLAVIALEQARQVQRIVRSGIAVGDYAATRAEPGEAAQGREHRAQVAQCGFAGFGGWRLNGVLPEHRQAGARLEIHAQGEVVGQLRTECMIELALIVLQLARLQLQLPQQQRQHTQHQGDQGAFDRAAQRRRQRFARRAR